jgi:hypothetical protein
VLDVEFGRKDHGLIPMIGKRVKLLDIINDLQIRLCGQVDRILIMEKKDTLPKLKLF